MVHALNWLIAALGLARVILLPHLFLFLVAMGFWSWKSLGRGVVHVVLDLVCALASVVAGLVFLILLLDTDPPSAQGNVATWYLIYGVVTLGLVPLTTLSSFFLSGRLAGRVFQRVRAWRQLTGTVSSGGAEAGGSR